MIFIIYALTSTRFIKYTQTIYNDYLNILEIFIKIFHKYFCDLRLNTD